MKKVFAVVLALAMAVSMFTGCSSKPAESNSAASATSNAAGAQTQSYFVFDC